MDRRAVGPTATIHAWLRAHPDPVLHDVMHAWIHAVSIDPDDVTTDAYRSRSHPKRIVRLSNIHPARTCVTFIVVDTPARAIHILSIDDNLYQPSN